MKLAVINCKALKQDHTCAAHEMYNKSAQFRAQLRFITEAYDHCIILSAAYGVVELTDVIDTYSISIAKGPRLKAAKSLTKEEKVEWALDIANHSIWDKYDTIHFHVGSQYWKPIAEFFPNDIHVKQQVNPGLVIKRYDEALEYYNEHKSINLDIISTHVPSKEPEVAKPWYHSAHGERFGYSRDISKEFGIDEGNLYRVSRGKANHTCGWTVVKDIADNTTYNGRNWSYKKVKKYPELPI